MKSAVVLVFIGLIVVGIMLASSQANNPSTTVAAKKEYKYKCPITGQVFTFDRTPAPKCPIHDKYHLAHVN